jgi:hypothetical protein
VADKVVVGQDFLKFFGFSCQYHSTLALHTRISRASVCLELMSLKHFLAKSPTPPPHGYFGIYRNVKPSKIIKMYYKTCVTPCFQCH